MNTLSKLVLILILFILNAQPSTGEDRFKVDTLIAGDWGSKEGEFGIDRTGKTELGYAIDLQIVDGHIYILDAVNNRIQVFDLTGRFKSTINLNIKWQDFGLPWDFTLYKNSLYFLIGKAPYYNSNGITEVHKFTANGKFVNSFGVTYISKNKEEYYNAILSDIQKGYLYGGLGGTKIIAFDAEGNLKDSLLVAGKGEVIGLVGMSTDGDPLVTVSQFGGKNRRTVLINPDSKKIVEEVKGRFTLADGKGRYFDVHTMSGSKRKKTVMTTTVEVFNSIENKAEKLELKGDVNFLKNDKDRIYRYAGNFFERSVIDSDGNVYHLIALEDGVILRKITMK